MYMVHIHAYEQNTHLRLKKKIHPPRPSCFADDISHCLPSKLELTHATAAVRCRLVSLGARASEGAGKVLAPSWRTGTALGAFVDICREER